MSAREENFAGVLALDQVGALACTSSRNEGEVMIIIVIAGRMDGDLGLSVPREYDILAVVAEEAEVDAGGRDVNFFGHDDLN